MPDQKVLDTVANAELDHLIATTMQLLGASSAPAAMRMKSGSIYFRKDAHWLPEYEDELVAFDKGTHDDQVDVTSYAARCLVETFAEDESKPFIVGI